MWRKVLGQEPVKKFLEAFLDRQERPHALLFAGPAGVGKRLLAGEFARSVLCLNGGRDEDCRCASCRLLNFADGNYSKAHPDLIYMDIGVFGDSKATTEISIVQIDALKDQGSFAPALSPAKVCIINNADKMSREAGGALLKLLEEPAAGWLFVLVAERPSRLLSTVRSRAVQLNFAPLPEEVLIEELIAKKIPAEEARIVAPLAEGSLGLALELYSPSIFADGGKEGAEEKRGGPNGPALRETALAYLEELPLRYPFSQMAAFRLGDHKRPQGLLLALTFCQLFHDVLLLQDGAAACIYNKDQKGRLDALARRFSRAAVRRAYGAAFELGEKLAGSVGVRLALEQMFLRIDQCLKEG